MNPELAKALQEHMGLVVHLVTACEDTEESVIAARSIREATLRLSGLFEVLNATSATLPAQPAPSTVVTPRHLPGQLSPLAAGTPIRAAA
jgi:hypothetical protein